MVKEREESQTGPGDGGLSRRNFLKGVALGSAAIGSGLATKANAGEEGQPDAPGLQTLDADGAAVVLNVNGRDHNVRVMPSETLLTVLREKLELTGAKEVCGQGACGACTVLVDGRAVNACMMLAADALHTRVVTVEGLGRGEKLSPVQQAFVDHDACQCGYCIPGFVVRSHALLNENPAPTLAEIKKGLAGNVCRCGAYTKIFEAVESVARGKRS